MANALQIGNNIRKFRREMGLTQRMLAKKLLVSYQAVSAWERGQSVPDLTNAAALAQFFGVSLDALVFGRQ